MKLHTWGTSGKRGEGQLPSEISPASRWWEHLVPKAVTRSGAGGRGGKSWTRAEDMELG